MGRESKDGTRGEGKGWTIAVLRKRCESSGARRISPPEEKGVKKDEKRIRRVEREEKKRD